MKLRHRIRSKKNRLWDKLFRKACHGDATAYWANLHCLDCTPEDREECYQASFEALLIKEEIFRKEHGHDRRYAVTRYWESKGKKGWGKYHEKYKGK